MAVLGRIAVAASLLLTSLLGGAWLLLAQPFVGRAPNPSASLADPHRLQRDVEYLALEVPLRDASHPEQLAKAAAYIEDELGAAGADVEQQTYETLGRRYANVVASLGPRGGGYVVVGAHYDTFGEDGGNPGADDNASGVAVLLETARLLAGSELPVRAELVAYSTEEPSYTVPAIMGSAVHARSLATRGRMADAMICLEMVGYFTERQEWPSPILRVFYPSRGDFVMIVGRWSDRSLIRRVKGPLGSSGTRVVSYGGPLIGGMDASDHRSYWRAGIPAVMITDTAFLRNPNYHQAGDVPATLDYQRMAALANGLVNVLRAW